MQPYKNEGTIVICAEEPEARHGLETALKSFGYLVQSAVNGDEVLSFVQDREVETFAVVLDVAMPNRGGLDILREIRAVNANLPVIVISRSSSIPSVVAAIKAGATEFIGNPFTREELARVLTSVLESGNAACKPVPRNVSWPQAFISTNPRIKEIESGVGQIGWSGVPVLIQGETGSGKEVLARNLHGRSARANKPFLKLNCAALPSELVESELFGYERGAFTGALERKAGIFELADGGTILLDEIGDMDVRLQAKLLQVLQDQEFRRIGGKETVKVNVRIMAATHKDLEKAIRDRTFREDLYYRLNVIVLQVPPLRERTEDMVPLAEFLIRKHAHPIGPIPSISVNLRHAMMSYNWPGNVRELENCMRKLVIFRDPDAMACDLQARVSRRPPMPACPRENHIVPIGRRDSVSVLEQVTKSNRQAEIDAILAALNSTRWNRKLAARILKIDYKSLLYKMKKLGLDDNPPSVLEPLVEAAS
jgi:two-component system, NtrC family, response regulator AtoC